VRVHAGHRRIFIGFLPKCPYPPKPGSSSHRIKSLSQDFGTLIGNFHSNSFDFERFCYFLLKSWQCGRPIDAVIVLECVKPHRPRITPTGPGCLVDATCTPCIPPGCTMQALRRADGSFKALERGGSIKANVTLPLVGCRNPKGHSTRHCDLVVTLPTSQ
jgi:hypothetical protein